MHNKLNLVPTHEQIESFNPTVSRYRKEHAPNHRYLPSDITVQKMNRYWKEEKDVHECFFETHLEAVKKLDEEYCDQCIQQHTFEGASDHKKRRQDHSTPCCVQKVGRSKE